MYTSYLRERDGGELKPALVTLRAEAHPGVLVLKYDTLRAKLLKCSEGRSGANLLKWVTPPAKLLNHGSKHGNTPGIPEKKQGERVFCCFRLFAQKGLRSVGAEQNAKLSWYFLAADAEQNC